MMYYVELNYNRQLAITAHRLYPVQRDLPHAHLWGAPCITDDAGNYIIDITLWEDATGYLVVM